MIVWNRHYTGSKKERERLKYKVNDLRLLDLQYIEISKRGFYNFYSVVRITKQDLLDFTDFNSLQKVLSILI